MQAATETVCGCNEDLNTLLWIDTDPGIDDMFAIYVALTLYDKGVKVLGISTTFGNTNESQCSRNLKQLLRAFKVSPACKYIPKIYRGPSHALDESWKASARADEDIPIHGANGLGDLEDEELEKNYPQIWAQTPVECEKESFVTGIEKALNICEEKKKPLTFVSLGALTTLSIVATVFRDKYESGLVQPIVMGGALPDSIVFPKNPDRLYGYNEMLKYDSRLGRGNMAIYGSEEAEHNVFRDVLAAKNILCKGNAENSPCIFLVDWCQTILSALTNPELGKKLKESKNEFVRYMYRVSRDYPDFSFRTKDEHFFMIICDLVALWFGLFSSQLKEESEGVKCIKRGFIEDMEISRNGGGVTKLQEDDIHGNVFVASYIPDSFLDEISERLMILFSAE